MKLVAKKISIIQYYIWFKVCLYDNKVSIALIITAVNKKKIIKMQIFS